MLAKFFEIFTFLVKIGIFPIILANSEPKMAKNADEALLVTFFLDNLVQIIEIHGKTIYKPVFRQKRSKNMHFVLILSAIF